MAEALIKEETLTAIADKIREKTGTSDTYQPQEMAAGVADVYDAGKQAEYDMFWGEFLGAGSWQYRFAGRGWNDVTFKPPQNRKIKPDSAAYMFRMSFITDLKGILESRNTTIDFSANTNFTEIFAYAKITRIPEINASAGTSLANMFTYCPVKTIDKLILNSNGTQTFSSTFASCSSLANITIEGVIGQSISFSASPLTKDSITSVVNALSSTVSGKTLTLKKTAVNNAFGIDVDDETTWGEGTEFYELRHLKDNWTFSYV